MNFLFVTMYDLNTNSSSTLRNISLIKGLLTLGHSVDILTSENIRDKINYDESFDLCKSGIGKRYYLKFDKKLEKFISKKGTASNKNLFKDKIKLFLKDLYKRFTVIDAGRMNIRRVDEVDVNLSIYDYIISSSDPKSSHLLAKRLFKNNKNLKEIKWIQYWGDPLAVDITKKTVIPAYFIKNIEYNILKNAYKIVYVSPFTLELQKKEFPKLKNKMFFLPIAYYDQRIYYNDNQDEKKYEISYLGDYNSKFRNIKPLYNACMNNKDLKLNIIGNSDLSLSNNENIQIIPRVSMKELTEYEKNSDLLIVLLNRHGTQLPGKIYHYAGTNKPILIIMDGSKRKEIKTYLEQFKRFYFCDNTEEDITKKILEIKNTPTKWEPSPYLAPDIIASQFLEIIKN